MNFKNQVQRKQADTERTLKFTKQTGIKNKGKSKIFPLQKAYTTGNVNKIRRNSEKEA
jgi:hypothetical protein